MFVQEGGVLYYIKKSLYEIRMIILFLGRICASVHEAGVLVPMGHSNKRRHRAFRFLSFAHQLLFENNVPNLDVQI